MSFLGSIGKALGGALSGAVSGFLGSGFNPIGAIVGGVSGFAGSLLGGSKSLTQGSTSFQTYIPPYAQQGANLLNDLLKQSPQFAQTIANIRKPYIEKAQQSFESIGSEIPNIFGKARGEIADVYKDIYLNILPSLFNKGKSEVSGYYEDVLSKSKDIITAEQSKQNARLGALGLLNTQAQQWTLADILNRTAFDVLREKARALTGLTNLELEGDIAGARDYTRTISDLIGSEANTTLQYLLAKPQFYSQISDMLVQSEPSLIEQQYKMDIAKALMGVPTITQPIYQQPLLSYLPALAQIGTTIAGLGKTLGFGTPVDTSWSVIK
jgi:hypothetical protein